MTAPLRHYQPRASSGGTCRVRYARRLLVRASPRTVRTSSAQNWRTSVRVTEAVPSRGGLFFPKLVGGLVAQPDEVYALVDECALLRRVPSSSPRDDEDGASPGCLRRSGTG